MRLLLVVIGWLAVGLAALGLFLPVLPTTPFLILAASCFAKSSQRFHSWLITSPVFGKILHDWQTHRQVSSNTKRWAMVCILASFSISIWLVPWPLLKLALAIMAMAGLMGIYFAPGGSPFKSKP